MRITSDGAGIKINIENALRLIGTLPSSPSYDVLLSAANELLPKVTASACPRAAAQTEEDRAYCLLTLGEGVSDFSRALFDAGEGTKGLIADALADEYLFALDKVLGEKIRDYCGAAGLGVKKRLSAPDDIPFSEQRVIAEKAGLDGVGVTDAFALTPAKTLAYILEFTDDTTVFRAQHDCSKCSNYNCPRRSVAGGNFSVLSDYAYMPSAKYKAVCIDIGTTTIAFELIDTRGSIRTYKTLNPQRRFGTDVLSRIDAANRGRESEMTAQIRCALSEGFKQVAAGANDVEKVVICGNTTMIYLLMGYNCAELGKYPFRAEHTAPVKTTFDRLTGNKSVPAAETVIFGGISAFVGGDIVSGLYMCDFDKSDKNNLFIDIGTNGEIAAGNGRRMLVTSAAAGPAFEGGGISCGMGSTEGAVCGVDLKTDTVKTIGDKSPAGLCGTGVIELCSELLDAGIMDRTGLLREPYFTNGFTVADGIVFTQQDIRRLQTAKAAVRAGIEILLCELGVDIDTVYLAGGFGNGLSIEKACNIGLLPDSFIGKTRVIGNSALGGCAKYCSRTDGDERMTAIKKAADEIVLADRPEFNELYIRYMNF